MGLDVGEGVEALVVLVVEDVVVLVVEDVEVEVDVLLDVLQLVDIPKTSGNAPRLHDAVTVNVSVSVTVTVAGACGSIKLGAMFTAGARVSSHRHWVDGLPKGRRLEGVLL